MNDTMLTGKPNVVNARRFVPALSEYDQGKSMYRRGKSLAECVTDEQTAGWLDAEQAGADAYYRQMMAEAVL